MNSPSYAVLRLASGRRKIARNRLKAQAAPLRAPLLGGGWLLVHRSTRAANLWQATCFDDKDEPWGDSQNADFGRLLDHADGWGVDWKRATRVGLSGQVDG